MSDRIRITSKGVKIAKAGKSAASSLASDFLLNTELDVLLSSMVLQTSVSSADLVSFTAPTPTGGGPWLSIITATYRRTIAHNLGYIPPSYVSILPQNTTIDYNVALYTIQCVADANNVVVTVNYTYYMQQATNFTPPGAGSTQIPNTFTFPAFTLMINSEKWV